MQKVKSYVLPIAIVLGLLLHDYCAALSVVVPYIIFTILLLTFTAVDVRKLRFKPLFIWIILFQVAVSLGGYYLLRLLNINEIIAEGILIGVLCPVAASVAVVSTMNHDTACASTAPATLSTRWEVRSSAFRFFSTS